jgi:arginine/ornithine N-succinyltransferase beta subunit
MQESFHLLALDNHLAKVSPLNSMTIDPKYTQTLYGVLSAKTKNLFDTFASINTWFFLFLLLQVGA